MLRLSGELESLRPVRLRCACLAAPHGPTATPSTPRDRRWREAGGWRVRTCGGVALCWSSALAVTARGRWCSGCARAVWKCSGCALALTAPGRWCSECARTVRWCSGCALAVAA